MNDQIQIELDSVCGQVSRGGVATDLSLKQLSFTIQTSQQPGGSSLAIN